uniref:peroxidase n=1 Tax=Populus alba TaxID=43335 RepID=A0A4U5QSV3_POPAL|nr:class III peroxidase [Populus alba]
MAASSGQGCDASVLVNSTANNTAEKDAIPNLSLAGFDTHVQERPPQPGQQPALQLHRKRRRRPFPEPNIRCFLKKPKCKILNDAATTVEIDPGSSRNFDTAYFAILKQREGLFQSDAALLTNRTPNKIVGELLNSNVFFRQSAQPMKRMGAIGVLHGTSGEIRKKCSVINS